MVQARIGRLLRTIRSAAAVDPDAGALWQLIQSDFYANQRVLVATIHERGGLRPDLDVDRATDILWTLNHPDVWLLLVGDRGWTPEQFEAWFADTVVRPAAGGQADGAEGRDELLPGGRGRRASRAR